MAELVKYVGDPLHQAHHQLCLRQGTVNPYLTNVNCPIHKKDDIKQCSNSHITLLSTIFSGSPIRSKHHRLQRSFTPGKSVAGQIFSLGQAMENLLENGDQLHHLLIDFKAAYDRQHQSLKPLIISPIQKITTDNSHDKEIRMRLFGLSLETSHHNVKAFTVQDNELASYHVFLGDFCC